LGGSVHAVKKNTKALVVSEETGLEVNADNTKYMVMSPDQNAGRSHSIKTNNSSFGTWKSSDIWKRPQQIKIIFRKK
jgi:hypothetical protein